MRRIKYSVPYLVVALMFSACNQAPPADALREGQLFPDLRLSGLDRADISVVDLRGRWIILNVWATWCGPCRAELAGLQQLDHLFEDHQLVVLGLNVDNDQHIAREFLRDQGISFANYSDPDMFIAHELLGIRAFPDTFIIAPDGTLRRSLSGERDWASSRVIDNLRRAVDGQVELLEKL